MYGCLIYCRGIAVVFRRRYLNFSHLYSDNKKSLPLPVDFTIDLLATQTVRLCPPLVITEGQVGAAIDIIEKVLSKI
jgi:acetylornithine/succinyldiaminopimelate/putrescine aminotransferase